MCMRIEDRHDYARYEQRVSDFFSREGLANLSTLPHEDDYGNPIPGRSPDPYFSWQPCACCGGTLGGERYDCNGYNPYTGEIQEYDGVCMDCYYYAEYGRLDDTTMYRVENTPIEPCPKEYDD